MLLSAEHLSINFGSRQLLEDVNFYLNEGDKVGVIGINGTGKSTFLKVLAGKLEADAGTISRNPNVQVSLLEQNPPMEDDATVLEQVFLHFPKEFRELNEYEAKSMLNKLGLPDYEQKVGTLSGGQRKRVALAAALIHPADVLILDEPTNHLDAEMTAWLEDWLRRFKGGLVMVTHDRYFLERVVNHITELSRGKLYHYEANYSKYLELKAQRAEMAEASERKRQSILRTEREWIMRGCRARTTKSKDRIERYEALKNQEAPETDDTVQLAAASSRLGKKLIELHDVSKSYEGRTVIRDFSYNLLRNDRIGIVGHNGAGKSTLLRLFAGELSPDSGTVDIGTTVKIGHFSQEGRELDLNQRVYDFIHDIGDEVRTDEGTFTAKAMMERFLFPSDLQSVPIGRLSGGERRRLYLLSILMEAPNVLLLDEPTNHLDIESIQWLENFIATRANAVILVSHDRAFIDNTTFRTIEIELGKIYDYKVKYSEYVELRKERREQQLRAFENQQKKLADTEAFIERFRYKATKSVQVQSRIKQLEKVERIEVDEVDTAMLSLKFPPAPRSGSYPVIAEDVAKRYGDHLIFEHATFTISRGDKVAFVGKNGEGKSTLVKCIMGEITDFTGKLQLGHNVKIGYFAQNQAQLLDENMTVFDTVDYVAQGDIRLKIRDILGAFMFGGEASDKKVKVLSGGEKTRLAMIRLLLEPVNLLILDEPTNHLDMRSKDVLKDALKEFDGTVIVVSHDREFLDGLVDKVYEFGNKRVIEHLGGIYDFLEHKKMDSLCELERSTQTTTSMEGNASEPTRNKLSYEARKEQSKAIKKVEKAIAESEKKITELENSIAAIEAKLATPEGAADVSLYTEYSELKKKLSDTMDLWTEQTLELEELNAANS